jgi:transposase
VDWRTGKIVRLQSAKRNAHAFCRLLERCLARSARRKRRVIVVTDKPKIHTPEGSREVASLLARYRRRLKLRYIPKYSPEDMPLEKFWNDWRDNVTHNHDRDHLHELKADSRRYFARRARDPDGVLRIIGSPFANPRPKAQKLVGFI